MSTEKTVSNPTLSKSRELFTRISRENFVRNITSPNTRVEGSSTVKFDSASTISKSEADFNPSVEQNITPKLLTLSNLHEGVQLNTWKLVANISAKVLIENEEYVLLDCLIDKEERLYEEREFSRSLFEGFELHIGSLFKVCISKRQNHEMIEIKDGSRLVNEDDFPKIDFFAQFGDLNLHKKIG